MSLAHRALLTVLVLTPALIAAAVAAGRLSRPLGY